MIKANELRIGNFYNIGQVFIDNDFRFYAINAKGETHYLSDLGLSMIEPIPLTPEVLQKCGFKPDSFCFYHGICYIDLGQGSQFEAIALDNIMDLHQFQNLYFTLTGKELKIKKL